MPLTLRLSALLAGLMTSLPSIADEQAIDIKTDLTGQYFIVTKSGTEERPIVLVKRAAPTYNHFIKREFDCTAHTVRYLSEGDSAEAMVVAQPPPDASPIRAGSISDQLARLVCPGE